MSYDTDYLIFLVNLRQCHDWYVRERKALYFRKFLTYAFFVVCKVLTLQQIKQIVFCDNDNTVRKELASYTKSGEVKSEEFKYCGRYSAYSVTKKGLKWLSEQIEHLSNKQLEKINNHVITEQYKIHQRDKLSNHLVCINQFLISLLCAAHTSLDLSIYTEYAFSLKNVASDRNSPKSKDQIVSDLTVFHQDFVICVEADTLQVKFAAPHGPSEKVSKYAMLYMESLDQNSNFHLPIHILFSLQKDILPGKKSLYFTEQELKVLRNTEKVNSSTIIIRLISELHNCTGTKPINTIEEVLQLLIGAAPQLSEQLVHSSLLQNTSTVLNCLIEHGFGQLECSQIRRGINQLLLQVKQDTYEHKLKSVHLAEEKRKEELFFYVSDGYKKQALLNGMSLSCFSSDSLTYILPCIKPNLYYSLFEIENVVRGLGLILPEKTGSLIHITSLSNKEWSKSPSSRYFLNNVYQFIDKNKTKLYICIENISDDIGGFFRVNAYLKEPYELHREVQLIALVRDDYQLADGSILSTKPELMDRENQRKRRVHFLTYREFLSTKP